MGCVDYFDGIWEWPQGLAHYVEKHSVVLPQEFIDTMRANAWKVPVIMDGSKPRKLKRIGYWYSPDEPDLPDPRTLVCLDWMPDDLPKVVSYLRQGRDSTADFLERLARFEQMVGEITSRELLVKAHEYSYIPTDEYEFWIVWAQRQQSLHSR